MNEIIANELITHLSDAELKMLKRKIDSVLSGDTIGALSIDSNQINLFSELDSFLKAKGLEGKSLGTIKGYNYIIKKMITYINKPVIYINTEDIRNYLGFLKSTGTVADITLNNDRLAFNSFFEWLEENGYISSNPCKLIKPIKFEKKEREPLDDMEMELLRDVCKTSREKAIIEVLYSTGCRVSELVGLKLMDIDLEKREVYLFGKGKKHRTSYLNARAVLAITKYLKERNFESDYLFCGERSPHNPLSVRSIQMIVKSLGEKAKLTHKVTPHVIRHTTATDALDRGMQIEQVQTLLGHEKIETTLIYAKCNRENVKTNHFKYII